MDTSYHKLICNVANKIYRKNPSSLYDVDDLIQECYLKLPEIISKYSDKFKVKITSWISTCLERRLLDFTIFHRRRVMAHVEESHDRGYKSNHEDVVDIKDLISNLSPAQVTLLQNYYWEGKSFITIAAQEGKYKSTIFGRHEVIIRKLRDLLQQ